MQLRIFPNGTVKAIYAETIDLATLGLLHVTRASHVEPDARGCWHADLRPVAGPILGPFDRRSTALDAERDWLAAHWLIADAQPRR
jgi:hypothetical protein